MSFGNSSKVSLDLRGTRLSLEREALMELPESVLLCLFPNGVVLSPQRLPRADGDLDEDEEDEDVYYVDFDAQCLEFVLDFFNSAKDSFYGHPDGPRRDLSLTSPIAQSNMQNPLFLKQAIIVLREELEYFAIPPSGKAAAGTDTATLVGEIPGTDEAGKPNKSLLKLKVDCGNALLERKSIFTALQRNVNRENNVAEQHLIDMLCMSGFEREDVWGYRSLEPNRCCIASIALVLLKTGIVHPPLTSKSDAGDSYSESAEDDESGVQVNAQQLATAQKLLLFWRKPARKCWWDATDLTINPGTAEEREIKVWARRVWTLELSLI
ncbi:Whi2p [Sporobolomyces koalae]|uniref:Whi2p n=1 Tax=Sporobolomyces koalae TaxID=500713 RepID=UPI00317E2BB6